MKPKSEVAFCFGTTSKQNDDVTRKAVKKKERLHIQEKDGRSKRRREEIKDGADADGVTGSVFTFFPCDDTCSVGIVNDSGRSVNHGVITCDVYLNH